MAHDVAAQVRGYMFVFGALLVLTLVTVGVSYLRLPETPAVIIGISIALTKAALVAMYFMHLKGEKPAVYWPLGLTASCSLACWSVCCSPRAITCRHAVRRRVSPRTKDSRTRNLDSANGRAQFVRR
jgi:caa(3)-type oxidase subunit IV